MNEKAKEARRAYKREWARRNPDKVRAQQERYWTKKAEEAERESKAQASPVSSRQPREDGDPDS